MIALDTNQIRAKSPSGPLLRMLGVSAVVHASDRVCLLLYFLLYRELMAPVVTHSRSGWPGRHDTVSSHITRQGLALRCMMSCGGSLLAADVRQILRRPRRWFVRSCRSPLLAFS